MCYGDPVVNVTIECETCATVLLDFNQGNKVEVFNVDVLRKMESNK